MIKPSAQAMDSVSRPSMFQFPQVAAPPAPQRSPTPSNGSSNQEDHYHQYHEPLDPPNLMLKSPTLDNNSSKASIPLLPNFYPRSPILNTIVPPPPLIQPALNIRSPNNSNGAGATTNAPANLRNLNALNQSNLTHHETSDGNNNMKLIGDINNDQNRSCNAITTATTTNITGITTRSIIQQNNRHDVSEDIYLCYVTLKSKDAPNNLMSNAKRSTSSSSSNVANHNQLGKYEELEDELTSDKTPTNSPLISPSKSSFKNVIEPFELRYHCIRELIETEFNYVNALEMMIDCFARPLEKFLRKDDAMLIFNHVKQFHRIHTLFHGDLKKSCMQACQNLDNTQGVSAILPFNSSAATQSPNSPTSPASLVNISATHNHTMQNSNASSLSPASSFKSRLKTIDPSTKLSSCFLHWKDKFVLYGDYCSTLSKAQNLIDELCAKNEQFAMQIERCQQEANEGKFKLRDLLSLPMQRILKYHLLLSQLIKNTPSTHEDYNGLKRAHEAMMDLGQYINEVKRDTEAVQIINDIQSSISELDLPSDTQLADYGRLVKDGELKVKSIDDTKVKSRYVFVFDKVILMCKSIRGVRGEQYSYKEALVLDEYEIDDSIIGAAHLMHAKHTTKEKWSHYFSLVRSGDRYVYTFFAKTLESKIKWLEYIQKAMDNSRPAVCRQGKTNHAFLMHTFDKATCCDHCSKLLHGRYYQGYRCKVCFLSAHKQCLIKTRACGTPSLPPRYLSTTPLTSIIDSKEPTSPSVKSNCSDDSNSVFINFSQNTISSQKDHNFAFRRQAYSNENNFTINNSQFQSGHKQPALSTGSSRDLTSMVNVNLQNSSNNLVEQRRMLGTKGSKSMPAINQLSTVRVIATAPFEGDTQFGRLSMRVGDILAVYQSMVRQSSRLRSDIPGSSQNSSRPTTTWWLGKNLRTGQEGHFPSNIVEVYPLERKRVSYEDPQHTLESIDDVLESEQPRYDNVSPRSFNMDSPCGSNSLIGTGCNYVNFILEDYPWFSGRMERDRAQALLENKSHGTFLVRISPKQNGSYVISLNYNGQVKHMRIHVTDDSQLFLSQTRYFKSLVELVTWYEKNSLMESFHLLDARLVSPYKGTNR